MYTTAGRSRHAQSLAHAIAGILSFARGPWRAAGVFLVFAAGLGLLCHGLYRRQADDVRRRAADNLENSALSTARQIEHWAIDSRLSIASAAENPALIRAVRGAIAGDAAALADLRDTLEFVARSEEFDGVEVTLPGGEVVAATGRPIPPSAALARHAERARITGRVVMTDLYAPMDRAGDRPVVDVVAALYEDRGGAAWAMLVARVDPERFLYPALNTTEGNSALPVFGIARRAPDGTAVVMTDQDPDSGGRSRLHFVEVGHSMVATRVMHGKRGVFEALDNRGEPVLATGFPIADTPWFLVATASRTELFASLQQLARTTALFGGAGLAVIFLLATLWWRKERFSLTARVVAAELRAQVLREHLAVAGRLVHDLVLLLDAKDGSILEANDRAIEAYGHTREELLHKRWHDLFPPGSMEAASAAELFDGVVHRGCGSLLVHHRRRDGTPLPLEVSARTLTIDRRTYVQAIGRDVTERLGHEARVAAVSAERDRLLERMQMQFDRMVSACVVIGADGRLAQANPAFERTFGCHAHDVVGRGLCDFAALPGLREQAQNLLAQLHAHPEVSYSGVHENVTAQGRGIICRWTAAALRSPDGTAHGVIAMADDITELVHAERALRSSEERYRALTEVSPVGVFRADPAGKIVFMNPLARAVIGAGPEQVDAHAWINSVHPDDASTVIAVWTGYLENRAGRRSLEFRFVRPNGQCVWVLTQVQPEHDGEGQLVGHVGTVTDVTALKRAHFELLQAHDLLEQRVRERTQELEAAKDAAEHSDRVKTAFLSSVSHELRTPLNAILGFTDVVLQGLSGPLTTEQTRQLDIVRTSATRLRAMVEDVLDISRIEAGQVGLQVAAVDLLVVLGDTLGPFADAAARKGVGFDLRATGTVLPIRTDARRVAQVVSNLVSNAVKFTDAGSITVELLVATDRVEVVVSDTGVGIPAGSLGDIFDPFAQVVRPGGRLYEGTGLGLAIARNLARALGGDLQVRSEVGRGSRFTFWLPVRAAIAA
jgi:PAS domain S-box-containing protein